MKYINTEWTPEFAYAIGLLAADGNLSPDNRHINITSKDIEIPLAVKQILRLQNVIGKKSRGVSTEKKYYVLQFGSVQFYRFLLSIGLMPNKSKAIKGIVIPDEYFFEFFCGCFDGDGTIGAFAHPETVSPQLRVRIASASPYFIEWLLFTARRLSGISGGWISKDNRSSSMYALCFGKNDSIQIIKLMYARTYQYALRRKYLFAVSVLGEWRNWYTRMA